MLTGQEGGCRCGKIRFRIDAEPLVTAVCHCRGCQKMTASAFSTTITLPADALEILASEPVIGGLHGDMARHHHCDWCKSWLFTRLPPGYGAVNVRATMLDDANWFVPFMETYTSEMLPWAQTGAKLHTFPRSVGLSGADRGLCRPGRLSRPCSGRPRRGVTSS